MKNRNIILILASIFAIALFSLQACKDDEEEQPKPEPTPPVYTNGQGEVGDIGGTIKIEDESSPLNGVSVEIPDGALNSTIEISITEAPENIKFPGDSTQQLIQFLPEGLKFQKPVTIEIPYTVTDTTKLGIFYYDPETELISEIEKLNIDPLRQTISGVTDHFSYYAARDEDAGMTFWMFKTSENKIGVRLDVYGFSNNELGFKYLPTTLRQAFASGELNLWQVLSNDMHTNVYSVFRVYLREDQLIGSDPVDFSHFEIQRVQPYSYGYFAVDIFKKGESKRNYGSGNLFTYDIEENSSNIKNLGRWMNGEPIIFYFDNFTPDPDKHYFVQASWSLAHERSAPPITNYSPIYEFHNKPEKKLLEDLPTSNLANIDKDHNMIDDAHQVWGLDLPPVANFEVSTNEIAPGQSVQFTDLSTNNPTSWHWDFGDGNTSTESDPSHTYTQEGSYTVALKVVNAYGENTHTEENYISVITESFISLMAPNGNESWTAGNSYEITWEDNIEENVIISLKKNNTVVLTISNSTSSDGNYTWEIPASLGTANNYRVHIESIENSNVFDESENFFSIIEQGNIVVTHPTSNTVWTMGQYNVPIEWETGDLGGTVTIQMYKGENKLATLIPDAPNNGLYNGYNIQTTLTEDDDYRVKVISNVNSAKFDYSDYFEIIESENLPPEPPFDPYPNNGEVIEGLTANLFWSCSDPENDPLTYDVYAEKNNPDPALLVAANLETNTVSFKNLDENTRYYWKVIAKDDHGNETQSQIWNFETQKQGNAPSANFTATPTSGQAPLQVSFTDQSSNSPTSWQWDFGDGNSSTQPNPSHTYNNEGSYTVSLTVSNEYGSDTKTMTNLINVSNGGGGTGSFTDPRDGQTYQTVEIGAQTWMAENLNYETADSWWYDNSSANGAVYGRLYNWDAAMNGEASSNTVPSGVQGVCPPGWHLPSDDEWTVLTNYLGGVSVAGGKMKEAGTSHWDSPNTGATNSSGFTALPGGTRGSNGSFYSLGIRGYWWSSSEGSGAYAWNRDLSYDNDQVGRGSNYESYGFSVRCLKD